jgi:hypothetical protein
VSGALAREPAERSAAGPSWCPAAASSFQPRSKRPVGPAHTAVSGWIERNRSRETQIASGYTHRCDSAAFVVGPTGLALDRDRDVLYVASTGDNEIFAIHHASEMHSDRGLKARSS